MERRKKLARSKRMLSWQFHTTFESFDIISWQLRCFLVNFHREMNIKWSVALSLESPLQSFAYFSINLHLLMNNLTFENVGRQFFLNIPSNQRLLRLWRGRQKYWKVFENFRLPGIGRNNPAKYISCFFFRQDPRANDFGFFKWFLSSSVGACETR